MIELKSKDFVWQYLEYYSEIGKSWKKFWYKGCYSNFHRRRTIHRALNSKYKCFLEPREDIVLVKLSIDHEILPFDIRFPFIGYSSLHWRKTMNRQWNSNPGDYIFIVWELSLYVAETFLQVDWNYETYAL